MTVTRLQWAALGLAAVALAIATATQSDADATWATIALWIAWPVWAIGAGVAIHRHRTQK
ncbi:hypothetical protein [Streptomyces sp. NPDC001985]|uniref:hypothetical protein n=1 Tax=Streptomyces sp. NPDC001985 TaxID=3154406 RepID=UPI003323F909